MSAVGEATVEDVVAVYFGAIGAAIKRGVEIEYRDATTCCPSC